MAKETEISKIEKEAKNLTEKIIKLLGVKAKATTTVDEELIKIEIDGDDLGLLIGYRGENLESLQLLLGVILNKKLNSDPWRPVLVDVGGWRKSRDEAIRSLVDKEIVQLSAGRSFVELPPMPPAQRRTAHIVVSEHEGLMSESAGVEPNRYVVIKKSESG